MFSRTLSSGLGEELWAMSGCASSGDRKGSLWRHVDIVGNAVMLVLTPAPVPVPDLAAPVAVAVAGSLCDLEAAARA